MSNPSTYRDASLEEKSRLLEIIYAMGCDIKDLYTVNLKNREIRPYRIAGETADSETVPAEGVLFDDLMAQYVKNRVFSEDKDLLMRNLDLSFVHYELTNKESFHVNYRTVIDGEIHYRIIKCIRVGNKETFDTILVAFASARKSHDRKQMLRDVETDDLTGIYTRQAFMLRARKLLDEFPDSPFDLIVSDIDNFKLVNVLYGEAKGDDVLRFLGEWIKEDFRAGIVGRIGSDRIAAFYFSETSSVADRVGELLAGVKKNSPVDITLKCGVYANVDRSLPVSVMCERALLALKSIKHNYSLPYAEYDGPVSSRHMKVQMYESRFERSLKEGEFVIWYQPKHDSVTEQLVGIEALVRWKTPSGKFVSPAEFVPVFEEDGLIVKLDEYVFRSVCAQMRDWRESGIHVPPVSVNLSRASLHSYGTVRKYRKIAEQYGIPLDRIPLEITESSTIMDERIKNLMRELREAGFKLHMDDFGSGLSSLSSINVLPIDVVKLDKSLVDYIGDDGGDELLKHTVELAHFKKLQIIAEGVEDETQLDFLRGIGCDMIQGYYFAKPMCCDDLIEYFKTINYDTDNE